MVQFQPKKWPRNSKVFPSSIGLQSQRSVSPLAYFFVSNLGVWKDRKFEFQGLAGQVQILNITYGTEVWIPTVFMSLVCIRTLLGKPFGNTCANGPGFSSHLKSPMKPRDDSTTRLVCSSERCRKICTSKKKKHENITALTARGAATNIKSWYTFHSHFW